MLQSALLLHREVRGLEGLGLQPLWRIVVFLGARCRHSVGEQIPLTIERCCHSHILQSPTNGLHLKFQRSLLEPVHDQDLMQTPFCHQHGLIHVLVPLSQLEHQL